NGGHWVPEMIDLAGGEAVLGRLHSQSVRVTWEEIGEAAPDVVVFMPCGYDLPAAAAEAATFVDRPELAPAGRIFAVHADAYFSRPGPRLVDGVEILAAALHPDAVPAVPPGCLTRVR